MPQLIKTIDQLACENNRDQLYVDFGLHLLKSQKNKADQCFSENEFFDNFDWDNFAPRKRFIDFAKANGIKYSDCVYEPLGQIGGWSLGRLLCVEAPYNTNHPIYKKLVDFLEYPDGSERHDDIAFCFFPLEKAIERKKEKDQIEW